MSTLVPTEVTNATTSAISATSTSMASSTVSTSGSVVVNHVIKTEKDDSDDYEMADETSICNTDPAMFPPHQQLTTVRDESNQTKMTLGQMALAGIVISSGPGDHFETYEGIVSLVF